MLSRIFDETKTGIRPLNLKERGMEFDMTMRENVPAVNLPDVELFKQKMFNTENKGKEMVATMKPNTDNLIPKAKNLMGVSGGLNLGQKAGLLAGKANGNKVQMLSLSKGKMPNLRQKAGLLTGKSPKVNQYLSMSGNSKARQYLPDLKMRGVPSLGRTAKNRIRTQGKVSLFGDADRDKVLNVFDCKPLNPKRQGPENKVDEYYGKDFDYGGTFDPGEYAQLDQPLPFSEKEQATATQESKLDDAADSIYNVFDEEEKSKVYAELPPGTGAQDFAWWSKWRAKEEEPTAEAEAPWLGEEWKWQYTPEEEVEPEPEVTVEGVKVEMPRTRKAPKTPWEMEKETLEQEKERAELRAAARTPAMIGSLQERQEMAKLKQAELATQQALAGVRRQELAFKEEQRKAYPTVGQRILTSIWKTPEERTALAESEAALALERAKGKKEALKAMASAYGFGKTRKGIQALTTGLGQFGGLGYGMPGADVAKTQALIGGGTGGGWAIAQQLGTPTTPPSLTAQRLTAFPGQEVPTVPTAPMMAPTAQPMTAPTVPQPAAAPLPQFQQGMLKYSPYSKRPVSYVRGPYRKEPKQYYVPQ
jgi:hypothetical protein